MTTPQNKIEIFGRKSDGYYWLELRHSDGHASCLCTGQRGRGASGAALPVRAWGFRRLALAVSRPPSGHRVHSNEILPPTSDREQRWELRWSPHFQFDGDLRSECALVPALQVSARLWVFPDTALSFLRVRCAPLGCGEEGCANPVYTPPFARAAGSTLEPAQASRSRDSVTPGRQALSQGPGQGYANLLRSLARTLHRRSGISGGGRGTLATKSHMLWTRTSDQVFARRKGRPSSPARRCK